LCYAPHPLGAVDSPHFVKSYHFYEEVYPLDLLFLSIGLVLCKGIKSLPS
jgi:hypothetical protein